MEIQAIIPGNTAEKEQFLVKMSEEELDYATGIGKRPHISGRYKPGQKVNIGRTFKQLDRLQAGIGSLKMIPAKLIEAKQKIEGIIGDLES